MPNRGMILKCDDCGRESQPTNTDNKVVAQQILITFHHWKCYPAFEEVLVKKFRLACPECVRRYVIRQKKERQLQKEIK